MRLLATLAAIPLAVVIYLVFGSTANAQTQTPPAKPTPPKTVQVTVTIAPGDSLSGIASAHQTTWPRLFDANSYISDPNLIYPGNPVRIPDPSEQLPNRSLPGEAADTEANTSSTPAASVARPASAPAAPSASVSDCGDNSYANFIYSHESGCRTNAMSANGCYGIGQACPASKIAYCGADYACQNAYFTAYAGKYGGWAGAYAFWISRGWW